MFCDEYITSYIINFLESEEIIRNLSLVSHNFNALAYWETCLRINDIQATHEFNNSNNINLISQFQLLLKLNIPKFFILSNTKLYLFRPDKNIWTTSYDINHDGNNHHNNNLKCCGIQSFSGELYVLFQNHYNTD